MAADVCRRDRQVLRTLAPPQQHDVDLFDLRRRNGDDLRTAVRRACGRHTTLSLRGLRDRDLDAFFRHPANEFQMRVIAKKLDGFASALGRR
jgi:hypothetical protein